MSTKIDIITTGYARLEESSKIVIPVDVKDSKQQGKFMRATGSSCLVRSSGTNTLFDTMGPWERGILINRLLDLKIHPDDIDHLVCSHSHPDHIGNLNLFTKAKKHFVGTSVYSGDLYDLNCFEPTGSYTYKTARGDTEIEVIEYQHYSIDQNLSIEPSPGHTLECITMIVNNCDQYGSVALAGDLFENEQDVLDENIWLSAGSQNPDLQRASRTRIYNKVDHVLPGHGSIFKTLGHNKPLKF